MAREYSLKQPAAPKVSDDELCGIGERHRGKRIADVPADFLAWCWNKWLHKATNRMEFRWIVQECDKLDKETDIIMNPDPRTFRGR